MEGEEGVEDGGGHGFDYGDGAGHYAGVVAAAGLEDGGLVVNGEALPRDAPAAGPLMPAKSTFVRYNHHTIIRQISHGENNAESIEA